MKDTGQVTVATSWSSHQKTEPKLKEQYYSAMCRTFRQVTLLNVHEVNIANINFLNSFNTRNTTLNFCPSYFDRLKQILAIYQKLTTFA